MALQFILPKRPKKGVTNQLGTKSDLILVGGNLRFSNTHAFLSGFYEHSHFFNSSHQDFCCFTVLERSPVAY